jgi:hypothetical protein
VIFPEHPGTQQRATSLASMTALNGSMCGLKKAPLGAINPLGRFHLTGPLGYLDYVCLMGHAARPLRTRCGIQEEMACLGVPCVTVRENREQPVTVTVGTMSLQELRRRVLARPFDSSPRPVPRVPEKWDGKAPAAFWTQFARIFKRDNRFSKASCLLKPCVNDRQLQVLRLSSRFPLYLCHC